MWRFWSVGVVAASVCLVGCGPAKIEGLKLSSYASGQQQEGKIAYAENPPLGGAYSPLWQKCGVYPAPLYDEYAVHSLERGAVWLVYRPGLPTDQVQKLQSLLSASREGPDGSKVAPPSLLSPREDLPTPVVLSVWNAQVQASGPDDPRLTAFLDRYVKSPTVKGAANVCTDGYSGTQ